MTVELASFQHGDGVFHIKALAFGCPRTPSLGSRVFDSTCIVPDSAAALQGLLTKWPIMAFCSIHQAYRPPLLVWFYKPLFRTLCLIGWRGGNATPAKIILWTKGLQKVYLLRPPEQHPFPGAPHQPTELRGPSVSSTCTALFNHQLLVDLPESCQTCPLARRARFSSTTLTLRP